jgi:chitodextrinase
LSWTASTDNLAVTGYQVERCTGTGCSLFAQVGTPTTASFADSGLAASTTYSYRVLAVDAAGNLSGYSSVASVTTPTPDTTPPSAPSALVVSAPSSTQASLSWTAATDNVAVTGYRVERCAGAGCSTFTQVGTTTTFADSGLAPATTYNRVRATTAGNLGAYSSVVPVTTPAAADTTAVGSHGFGRVGGGSMSQINLSWIDGQRGCDGVPDRAVRGRLQRSRRSAPTPPRRS